MGGRVIERQLARVDDELWPLRFLVGRVDAGEIVDPGDVRLLVEPLGITLPANLRQRVNVDPVEAFARCGTRALAVRAVGRDEGTDDEEVGVREQRRGLPDAARVRGAVVGREAGVAFRPVRTSSPSRPRT